MAERFLNALLCFGADDFFRHTPRTAKSESKPFEATLYGVPADLFVFFLRCACTTAFNAGVGFWSKSKSSASSAALIWRRRPNLGASAKPSRPRFCQASSQPLTVSGCTSHKEASCSSVKPLAESRTACARCRCRWTAPYRCRCSRDARWASERAETNFMRGVYPKVKSQVIYARLLSLVCGHRLKRVWRYFEARLAFTMAVFNICVGWNGLQADENGFMPLSLAQFSS